MTASYYYSHYIVTVLCIRPEVPKEEGIGFRLAVSIRGLPTIRHSIIESRSSIFTAKHCFFFAAIAEWTLPSGAAGSRSGSISKHKTGIQRWVRAGERERERGRDPEAQGKLSEERNKVLKMPEGEGRHRNYWQG